jgi:GGDEF domain-containing protein
MPGFLDGPNSEPRPEGQHAHGASGGVSPRDFFLFQVQRCLRQARTTGPTSLLVLRFRGTEQSIDELPTWRSSERRVLIEALDRLTPSGTELGQLRENELGALLPGIAVSEIERVAERLVDAVREEQQARIASRFLSVAIGIGCSSQSLHEAPALLSLADIAVNYAEASGRGWHALVDSVPGREGTKYKTA